jgi:hypothetical protein
MIGIFGMINIIVIVILVGVIFLIIREARNWEKVVCGKAYTLGIEDVMNRRYPTMDLDKLHSRVLKEVRKDLEWKK